MYIPPQFEQSDREKIHGLIHSHPLATLVTFGKNGIEANHIPLHLTPTPETHGVLCGHVARANSMWRDYAEDTESLAIFHGAQAYISPSWYETKLEAGKVVPTWNYTVVHVYGYLRVIEDAAWIRSQLETLTQHNEAGFQHPWAVSDAPEEFTEKLIASVVGIELEITRLVGKWKVSQNQPLQNQNSVINGLNTHGQIEMAALIRG